MVGIEGREGPGSATRSTARYDLESERLHALYGFSAVFAVGILYSYRTSSFMRGKEYLLYAGGCLFIIGLGLRELALTQPVAGAWPCKHLWLIPPPSGNRWVLT